MNAVRDGEFLRGWPVLLGAVTGIAAGLSSLYFYSLGVFIKPLASEFGWSRAEVSLGALVGTLAAAAFSPLAGRAADRFGSLPIASGAGSGARRPRTVDIRPGIVSDHHRND
jgi:MFS family permease